MEEETRREERQREEQLAQINNKIERKSNEMATRQQEQLSRLLNQNPDTVTVLSQANIKKVLEEQEDFKIKKQRCDKITADLRSKLTEIYRGNTKKVEEVMSQFNDSLQKQLLDIQTSKIKEVYQKYQEKIIKRFNITNELSESFKKSIRENLQKELQEIVLPEYQELIQVTLSKFDAFVMEQENKQKDKVNAVIQEEISILEEFYKSNPTGYSSSIEELLSHREELAIKIGNISPENHEEYIRRYDEKMMKLIIKSHQKKFEQLPLLERYKSSIKEVLMDERMKQPMKEVAVSISRSLLESELENNQSKQQTLDSYISYTDEIKELPIRRQAEILFREYNDKLNNTVQNIRRPQVKGTYKRKMESLTRNYPNIKAEYDRKIEEYFQRPKEDKKQEELQQMMVEGDSMSAEETDSKKVSK